MPGTSRSFAPVWHSHAGRLYDRPGIFDVRVIDPVIFCASVTFILYNSLYYLIVFILRLDACSLILEPWSAGLVPSCLKLETFKEALAAGHV